jgi:hypothetical protein
VDERIHTALEAIDVVVDAYFEKPVGSELPDITSGAQYEECASMIRALVARGEHTLEESNFIEVHQERLRKYHRDRDNNAVSMHPLAAASEKIQ